jgi:hypothetical protein
MLKHYLDRLGYSYGDSGEQKCGWIRSLENCSVAVALDCELIGHLKLLRLRMYCYAEQDGSVAAR